MKKFLLQIIFSLTFFIQGCMGQPPTKQVNGLISFDISLSDSSVVFAFLENGLSNIYKSNLKGEKILRITSNNSGISYSHPEFSTNSELLTFIGFNQELNKSAIFLFQNDEVIQLTDFDRMITTAVFSSDNSEIFYLGAEEINNYSPIVRKAPHGMDIFSVDIETKKVNKISEMNAYSLTNLIVNDSSMYFVKEFDGPFELNLNKDIIKLHVPSNPKDVKTIGCSYFGLSEDYFYFLTAGTYQLYKMSVKSKKTELIFHNKYQIANFRLLEGSNHVAYLKQRDINKITFFNLENKSEKSISLNMK